MSQSGYSSSDLLSMQADAVRRVREMQRRARQQVTREPASPPPEEQERRKEAPPADPARQEQSSSGLSGLLRSLGLEDDRGLLLALILLLAHEEADPTLILALLYLMI